MFDTEQVKSPMKGRARSFLSCRVSNDSFPTHQISLVCDADTKEDAQGEIAMSTACVWHQNDV
jgi:hypothetical protein